MRLRALVLFALSLFFVGAAAGTASASTPVDELSTVGVEVQTNGTTGLETVYQCNWFFCNQGQAELSTSKTLCWTYGNGTSDRWDLILDKSSYVVGFLPRSTGVSVPYCGDLQANARVNSGTVYQCNWWFCNKGTVTGDLVDFGWDTGHYQDGSTGRWDLVLAKNSFVVGFLPVS